jgi:hypothetical protein
MSEEKNGEQEEEEREEEEEEEEVDDGHDDEQADVKHEPEEAGDLQGIGDKPDGTIVTEHRSGNNDKDDCSDLTDNNDAEEEQAPRTFPQKVSITWMVLPQLTSCAMLMAEDRPRT